MVAGNASVHQVYLVSRMTGEGRAGLKKNKLGAGGEKEGGGGGGLNHVLPYNTKNKIHSSCEIEYFVKTHLCKLCVMLRSRVLRVVCPH